MTQMEFAKGMTLLKVAYPKFEVNQTIIEVWYSFFEDIRQDVFIATVKSFIKNSRFPPSISELSEQCEGNKEMIQNSTLDEMYRDGYFHKGVDDNQAFRNYEKSKYWVSRGTEPDWLKEDMRNYYKAKLTQKEQLKLT